MTSYSDSLQQVATKIKNQIKGSQIPEMPLIEDFISHKLKSIEISDKFSNTLLHYAASFGDANDIEFILNNMKLNTILSTTVNNNNIIHCAIMRNNIDALKFLLQKKELHGLLSKKNIYGQTPLDLALKKNNAAIIELLKNNVSEKDFEYANEKNKPETQLMQKKLNQNLERYLAQQGQKENYTSIEQKGNCNGWSFLYQIFSSQNKEAEFYDILAVISKLNLNNIEHTKIPNYLLEKFGTVSSLIDEIINSLVVFQQTTSMAEDLSLGFSQRSRIEQYELMQDESVGRKIKKLYTFNKLILNKNQLIEMLENFSRWPGACIDVKIINHITAITVDKNGKLSYYDSNHNEKSFFDNPAELADHLFKTFKLKDSVIDGKVMISFNAQKFYNKNEIVPIIATPTAKPFKLNSSCGFTKLHQAVINNDQKGVFNLLKNGANINSYDALGKTALSWATEMGTVSIVTQLIKDKANLNRADKNGRTPFFIALQNENDELINLFLSAGADPLQKDQFKCTAIHYLANQKYNPKIWDLLIRKGIDLNSQNFKGDTALCQATKFGSNKIQIISKLLENGADINIANHAGDTPLMNAIKANVDPTVIMFLIKRGADIHQPCKGVTPLMAAKNMNNTKLVDYLIQFEKTKLSEMKPKKAAMTTLKQPTIVPHNKGTTIQKNNKPLSTHYQTRTEVSPINFTNKTPTVKENHNAALSGSDTQKLPNKRTQPLNILKTPKSLPSSNSNHTLNNDSLTFTLNKWRDQIKNIHLQSNEHHSTQRLLDHFKKTLLNEIQNDPLHTLNQLKYAVNTVHNRTKMLHPALNKLIEEIKAYQRPNQQKPRPGKPNLK